MNEIWKKNREKLLARMEMFSAAVVTTSVFMVKFKKLLVEDNS